jgi:hypothetical protein
MEPSRIWNPVPGRSWHRTPRILGVAVGLLTALSACSGGGSRATSARGSSTTSLIPVATTAAPTTLAPTTSAPSGTATTTQAPATTTVPTPSHSVDWKSITVPGAVCHATQPIRLRQGVATIPAPPGVQAGTSEVTVREWAFAHGDLYGREDDAAAVNVWCANTGGTADGQIENSWVLFRADKSRPQLVATLTPQRPSVPGNHVAYFDTTPGGIQIRPGTIRVKEVWYGPEDGTCCPTGRATTVWSLNDSGTLTSKTTIQTYPTGA